MAKTSISQVQLASNVGDDDLVLISQKDQSGTYTSYAACISSIAPISETEQAALIEYNDFIPSSKFTNVSA